ncbi:hypothetical protein [Guptibacillus algicola]|uniref:hypothetical protein n=1 Tax=Guptibacillus algicola TaxID=225844 RepID=UPI001CD426B9|nr:hypothetical protein [Alkalihalobacillus algicola]MCA0988432.1 hypothetical protein [Alkalihalobacillus algicola]
MKLKFVMILSALLALAACNSGSSSSENHLNTLMEANSEVKSEVEKLSEEFRNVLTAPDMESIPFEPEEVTASAQTKLEPNDITLYYSKEDEQLSLMQRDEKGKKVSFGELNVELDNDIGASFNNSESIRELTWLSENGNVMFGLRSVVPRDGNDEPMTKDELVNVANSIIEQRK